MTRIRLPQCGINLDTHADDIVNLATMEGLDQIVLVGWRYGGMAASEVLARIPDKVVSVIYLDAFVPEPGRSVLSYSQRVGLIDTAMQEAILGNDVPPLPPDSLGVSDPSVIAYIKPRLTPQPAMTLLQASKALAEPPPDLPITYVYAEQNPIPTFAQFLKKFEASARARTYTLNTSHLLMLTDPAGTLDILASVPVS